MDVIFVVAYQYGSIMLAVAPVSHPVLPRKSLALSKSLNQSLNLANIQELNPSMKYEPIAFDALISSYVRLLNSKTEKTVHQCPLGPTAIPTIPP